MASIITISVPLTHNYRLLAPLRWNNNGYLFATRKSWIRAKVECRNYVSTSVSGSWTARLPESRPQAFRIANHSQQIASLGGGLITLQMYSRRILRPQSIMEYNFKYSDLILTIYKQVLGRMSWVFPNGLGDTRSTPGRVILKTQKTVLDTALLYTQHYKLWVKGKVEQSREWSGALTYTSVWKLLKREPSGPHSTKVANFTYFIYFQLF